MTSKKKTMLDYVAESTAAMAANIKKSKELTLPLVKEYVEGSYKNIWIIASGSSRNASYCARYFMKKHLSCEVKVVSPFTFQYVENDFTDQDMVVVVSQSGYSTNSIAALQLLKDKGRRTIGLTGDLDSDFKNYSDVLIDYGVNNETVGYVTKGVTTLALFFMLFTLEVCDMKHLKTEAEISSLFASLAEVPLLHQQMQDSFHDFYQKYYKSFSSMSNAYFCSCGANIGTAMEGALKIGETVQVPTSVYEVEEYIHGPNLQLTPNYTVFIIDGGYGSTRSYEIFNGTRIITDHCFLITNNKDYSGDGVLCIPSEIPEEITPLYFLPFFQMLAFQATDDLHLWDKHPLQTLMDKQVAAKSENYKNSPLRVDDPSNA